MLAGIEAGRAGGAGGQADDRQDAGLERGILCAAGVRHVEGEDVPPDVQARLDGQAAAGFDPGQRCAMIIGLEAAMTVEWRGKYLEVHRDGSWEFAAGRRMGAAVILAVTEAREIVLVEQYRMPQGARASSCPPG